MAKGKSKLAGTSAGGGARPTENFINDMVNAMTRDYDSETEYPMSNSDLQGAVEAFAMMNKGVDEDKLLDQIRDRVETKEIEKSLQNTTAYNLKNRGGEEMTYYFTKGTDGNTYYTDKLGGIPKQTPQGLTEKQMISRAKDNGVKVSKIAKSDLVEMEKKRRKDRKETERFLTNDNVRNKGADAQNRAYRNYRRASRLAKRG